MNKVEIARNRIAEILTGDGERQWTLPDLLWQVNWALELEEMVSMATLRRALATLPEGCVTQQGRKLIVSARHFVRTDAVIAALRTLEHWDDHLPVLIERHKPTLRRALLLADDWSLRQSLEWAAPGNFEILDYVYGTAIRWKAA
jgi:hypothetical protein